MRTALDRYGDLFMPEEAIEPILSKGVRGALLEWLTEIFAEDELVPLGVGPRKKAIFDGPPGVGKTTLAHHLSARLGLPMLAVRPERVISKWVGQTGEQIGQLFDAARDGLDPQYEGGPRLPVVLFLDEFDALGLKRQDSETSAGDEKNQYVNTLLQRLEQHKGFVIAATNFGNHVDPAIWRRFDMHITLELPGQFEREQIIKRYIAPFGLPRAALAALAQGFETASPALMRQFCEHLKRTIVIGPKLDWDMRLAAVMERLVVTIQPHPDLGRPPMWASDKDHARSLAIKAMPWPLPMAKDLLPEEPKAATGGGMAEGNVVQMGRRP